MESFPFGTFFDYTGLEEYDCPTTPFHHSMSSSEDVPPHFGPAGFGPAEPYAQPSTVFYEDSAIHLRRTQTLSPGHGLISAYPVCETRPSHNKDTTHYNPTNNACTLAFSSRNQAAPKRTTTGKARATRANIHRHDQEVQQKPRLVAFFYHSTLSLNIAC